MTNKQKIVVNWSLILTIILAAIGGVAAFVRVQNHAVDPAQHLTRETLQREYVPRQELDHRLDAQDRDLEDIKQGIRDLKQEMRGLQ